MTIYQFDTDDQQHVADDQTIPLYQPQAQPTLWDRLLDRPIEWSAALIALIVVVAWLAASLPPVSVPDQAGISPTPTLGVPAVKAPQTPRLEKAVIAYDAPDGSELGALEPGRSYTVVARYGAAWAQLDAPGSGLVWVKAVDIGAQAGILVGGAADHDPVGSGEFEQPAEVVDRAHVPVGDHRDADC